jgi:hypothetical protein
MIFFFVDERKMGVPEKADLNRNMEECLGGVEFAEDIMVFIERSAMADHDVFVDDHRALLQFAEITHVLFRDVISGPVNGRRSDGIECLHCVQSADSLIMISPYGGDRFEKPDFLDGLIRRCAVADQISKEKVMIDFAFLSEFKEGQEGLHVSVNIRKNEITHG